MRQPTLTCPQCCCGALMKIGKNKWECENCGTSFKLDMLRKSLNDFVGREFTEDFIGELLGDPNLKRYPKLGERGWKWMGKYGVLYTLHIGNTWHLVMKEAKLKSTLSDVQKNCKKS